MRYNIDLDHSSGEFEIKPTDNQEYYVKKEIIRDTSKGPKKYIKERIVKQGGNDNDYTNQETKYYRKFIGDGNWKGGHKFDSSDDSFERDPAKSHTFHSKIYKSKASKN